MRGSDVLSLPLRGRLGGGGERVIASDRPLTAGRPHPASPGGGGVRIVVALILLLVSVAHGAPTTQPIPVSDYASKSVTRTHTASGATADAGFDWTRLVLAMAAVLGLIIALRYAAGILFPGARATRGSRAVRVLTRTPLAPRQQVMLLQVGRRVIVVGESGGNLSSLGHIDEPDEVAELLGQIDNAEVMTTPNRFKALFGRARNDFENGTMDESLAGALADERSDVAAPQVEEASSEIAGLIDRMRSLTRTMKR